MATQTTSSTNTNINQTVMPQWWTDLYGNYVLPQAVAASQQPYQAYPGPRVAGQNDDQLNSYQMIRNTVGGATPMFRESLQDFQNAGQASSMGAASPYLDAATGIDVGAAGLGAASPYWDQGGDLLTASAGRDTASQFSPYASQATGLAYGAAGAANPYFQASAQPTGLAAATPYFNAASGTFPGSVDAYISPYTSQVTDRIAQLGARNLSENFLPAISDDFVRAGQYGSTRQRDLVGRAVRDTQESVLGQQAQALESGYSTAGQLFNADQSRMAGLGATAGNLGLGQQSALLNAGQGLGSIGLSQAGLVNNIGQFGTSASAADAARQLSAGQGLANIGTSAGQIGLQGAQANASNALQAAQTAGTLSSADAARLMASGVNIQNLAIGAQNQGLAVAGALNTSGGQQQAQGQQSMDTAYQDWLRQQGYNWDQISKLAAIGSGTPVNPSVSGTSTTTTTAPGPSTTSQIAGLGLGVAGLANSGIFKAKGGAVKKKPQRNYSYGDMPRQGLGSLYKAAA